MLRWLIPLFGVAVLATGLRPPAGPVALAALPGGRVLVALRDRDAVAVVDVVKGEIVAEVAVGKRPGFVAGAGHLALASSAWDHTVILLEVAPTLRVRESLAIGAAPAGVVFDRTGQRAFVALEADDALAVLDVVRGAVLARWPVPAGPRELALSPDGKGLAVACEAEGCVVFLDTNSGKVTLRRTLHAAYHLRGLAFSPDGVSLYLTHLVNRGLPVRKTGIEEGWVVGTRLTRIATRATAVPAVEQIALDPRGDALADPEGLALDPTGKHLLLTSGGTGEVVRLDLDRIPWTREQPGDHLSQEAHDNRLLQRRHVTGRPTGVLFVGGKAVVANPLLDALQVLDGERVRTLALGDGDAPARRGERLFHDATRSHHHWLSCHTCHPDGHTAHQRFDTLNDGHHGNPKLTPSLRGVTRTGPWSWHGRHADLATAVRTSFTETMAGPVPTDAEVADVLAYLATLEQPPSPYRGSAAGRALFTGKAGCVRCHAGSDFTSRGTHQVFVGDPEPNPRFNPPSLRSAWSRRSFLHDGRAGSLEEVLRDHHGPERTGGDRLSEAESRALLAYLRSL